jgi:hypothetical protein
VTGSATGGAPIENRQMMATAQGKKHLKNAENPVHTIFRIESL